MSNDHLIQALKNSKEYFDRSTACLTEEDSGFVPAEASYTVAHQVAHVAQTVDWFFAGAFRDEGFDMDFEGHDKSARAVTSLKAARKMLDGAFDQAIARLGELSDEEMAAPISDKMIMNGQPRSAIVDGIVEHTSHHRGALTVYSRLLGHQPAMPYM